MSDHIAAAVSTERLLGNELALAAEELLARVGPDADALRLATVQALLALYWELRHQGRAAPAADSSLEWVSALVCSALR